MPKVIKGDALPGTMAPAGPALVDRKVIGRDVFSAQQNADEARRAGEQRAVERRARGEQEKQAAYQAAYRAGNLAGLSEVGELAIDGYFQRALQLRQAADDCVQISRHICSKILGRDPKVAESEERRIASEILLQAVKKQRLVIGLSRHDYAALERSEPKLLAALAEASEFALECAATVSDGSATLRAGEREFVVPLIGALDRLCKVLILPKVKLQFAAASADGNLQAAPAEPAEEPAAEDEYAEFGGNSAAADANEDEAEYTEAPEDYPAEATELAADGAAGEDAAAAGSEAVAADAVGADEAAAGPRRREESVGMHDISRLVAAIDAEDEDQ